MVPARCGQHPEGYAAVGSYSDQFRAKAEDLLGVKWDPGTAIFQYANDQRATTAWYHDHSLGMTRLNVYAGPAGFYLIRGGPHDLPPGALPVAWVAPSEVTLSWPPAWPPPRRS